MTTLQRLWTYNMATDRLMLAAAANERGDVAHEREHIRVAVVLLNGCLAELEHPEPAGETIPDEG